MVYVKRYYSRNEGKKKKMRKEIEEIKEKNIAMLHLTPVAV